VFVSGTMSADLAQERMNDGRSRLRYSARSSDRPWLASKISTLTMST